MESAWVVIEFLIVATFAGVVGVSGMTFFLNLVSRHGLAHVDMVRAVGSALTGDLNSSFLVGSILHGMNAIIFGIIYTVILLLLGLQSPLTYTMVGLTLGFIHGFVLSFLLVIVVAEHHPIEIYREPGLGVAAVHLIGHVIYGVLVGSTVAMLMPVARHLIES